MKIIVRVLRVLTVTGAALIVLLLVVFLFLTRPFVEPPWEPAQSNPDSIYETSDVPIVSPFHLETDPMAGLLLINFDMDPDTVYVGFEPQFFDDDIHGRGLLVIGWRVDERVDIYHDPGLRLDAQTYGITGKGLNAMTERSFSDALFELGPAGVQADIAFQDLQGRPVHLMVKETDSRRRSHFGLLAPMGVAASDPPSLPLVYVDGFYFVLRAGSEYRIEIDGRLHRNDPIPLILDGTRVYFLRYSMDPFIVMWNPDADARVRTLTPGEEHASGPFIAYADGVRYEVEPNGELHEIRRISRREEDREVVIEFSPALPHLLALADSADVAGAFRVTAQPSLGTVRGTWRVARRGGELQLEIIPDGGWTPGPAPRMARLLFRAVSMFRTWPTTYRWRGTIELPPADRPHEAPLRFRSGWERTGQ